VRELENAMHKGVILSTGNLIQPQDMGLDVGSGESSPEQIPSSLTEGAPVGSLRAVRDRCEHQAITEALRQAKGNVSLTSRLLDVDRKVLIRTMERLGIRGDDHREA
jgi:DNA-binding NtrC family response regulator